MTTRYERPWRHATLSRLAILAAVAIVGLVSYSRAAMGETKEVESQLQKQNEPKTKSVGTDSITNDFGLSLEKFKNFVISSKVGQTTESEFLEKDWNPAQLWDYKLAIIALKSEFDTKKCTYLLGYSNLNKNTIKDNLPKDTVDMIRMPFSRLAAEYATFLQVRKTKSFTINKPTITISTAVNIDAIIGVAVFTFKNDVLSSINMLQ